MLCTKQFLGSSFAGNCSELWSQDDWNVRNQEHEYVVIKFNIFITVADRQQIHWSKINKCSF